MAGAMRWRGYEYKDKDTGSPIKNVGDDRKGKAKARTVREIAKPEPDTS